MTRAAFDKISEGLNEALTFAQVENMTDAELADELLRAASYQGNEKTAALMRRAAGRLTEKAAGNLVECPPVPKSIDPTGW